MGKDLKAENLAISLPNKGCNKNCPYCVSKMTGFIEENSCLMLRNVNKVKNVAQIAEVTSVLFTGKGEPLMDGSLEVLKSLSKPLNDWPLEIQTNGMILIDNLKLIEDLYNYGINVIAISVDSENDLKLLKKVFRSIAKTGMITRMTLNITNLLHMETFEEILDYCNENMIRQLTLRKIVAPENPKSNAIAEWILKNAPEAKYNSLIDSAIKFVESSGKLIRTTNDGVNIWDCEGISFAHSDYCIQERNKGYNIRSLVFAEDGHLYTSWNSSASIIF